MPFSSPHSFPRAIVHIDGDCFFANVEIAQNPALKGKCVITGKERGIAASYSYEAKAKGVTRGMRVGEILKICPEAILLPSDYETYSIYSKRMFEIVRRYTPDVEEYSIDECFADLTGLRRHLRMPYEEMVRRIKHDLDTELGMTFSAGLAPSKTLAKIASKWKKPDGLTVIRARDIPTFLANLPIEKVWNIGPNTTEYLHKFRMFTALDFISAPREWVDKHLTKPHKICWAELRGEALISFEFEEKHAYQSISKVRTFTPPSNEYAFVFAQLSKNIERACLKLRRHGLVTDTIYVFLKTQGFEYIGTEIKISQKVCVPNIIVREVKKVFDTLFSNRDVYRATGVILSNLSFMQGMQLDLFQEVAQIDQVTNIFRQVDKLSAKYGKHTVMLGSSLKTKQYAQHQGDRGDVPWRHTNLLQGENKRQRLCIPFLGVAH